MARSALRYPPLKGVRTSNAAERQVVALLQTDGYEVIKRGWPDFLAVAPDGSLRLIEVKPTCRSQLSGHQQRVARALAPYGLRVELAVAECVCGKCPEGPPKRSPRQRLTSVLPDLS